jgi:hypothetical protein
MRRWISSLLTFLTLVGMTWAQKGKVDESIILFPGRRGVAFFFGAP